MTPSQIVDKALTTGAMLGTDGQQITITATVQPAPEFLESIRIRKPELIGELLHRQKLWLKGLAMCLDSTPELLLKRGIVEACDPLELWHTAPADGAKLILSWYSLRQVSAKTQEPDHE